MATFTDKELLFLSNLMHMKNESIKENGVTVKSPFSDIWNQKNVMNKTTIGDIINNIDTNQLRTNKYYADHIFDGEISGVEWADLIDAMKQSDICELKIQDVSIDDKKAISAYLTDKDGNAYVVFRGTAAGEWPDNFFGALVADTEQQLRALDYINSIPADHITVVGHSKGGNKAKYVAILSDKIFRCVSFDGQGFSQFFMEKYQDLIEANKNKITCYALDVDFVNILLYDIYHVKKYIKGNGITDFKQNHSPNSFLQFTIDWTTLKNNGYKWKETEQDQSYATLHSFVNYIAATIQEKDRESFFTFLGNVSAMTFGKKPPNYVEKYKTEELLEYLVQEENANELGLLAAYIIEYDEYDSDLSSAIIKILEEVGHPVIATALKKIKFSSGGSLKFFLENHKEFETVIFGLTRSIEICKIIDNMATAYETEKYKVEKVCAENVAEYDVNHNDVIRDYTQTRRELLLWLTSIETNEKPYDVKKWDRLYGDEDWYQLLDISLFQNNIDTQFNNVIHTNIISNQQLQQIFSKVDIIVGKYKEDMEKEKEYLKMLKCAVLSL